VSGQEVTSDWTYHQIGLLVTGKGEERFLPSFLRSLTDSQQCSIEVIRFIPQRSAITSDKRKAKMVKSGQTIPDSDEYEIGVETRKYLLRKGSRFVVLVDDLEARRSDDLADHFTRYRTVLDTMLVPMGGDFSARASVHFLINMVEAYFFADPNAINEAMEGNLTNHPGDVEDILHPKNDLKKLFPGFDEVVHGEKIAKRLNLPQVLSNPQTCASLRTLIKWCVISMQQPLTERFQLLSGVTHSITDGQIAPFRAEN
jgi:Domain of unknown function (DUF4276)